MLLKNQEEIGWNNFVLGRVCHEWEKIFSNQEKSKRNKNPTAFPQIWTAIYKFLAGLWRIRCDYVEETNLRLEQRTLDEPMRKYDKFTLIQCDLFLFEEKHIPKHNSTPGHKKCWLFNV